MSHTIMNLVESKHRKETPLQFRIGDTVNVQVRIVEGEKERIQQYIGVVIARRGSGLGETFTVRRIVANEGVERTFPMHSPFIAGVDVMRSGKVRRAKLYFLRDRVGKARKLREKRVSSGRSRRSQTDEKEPAAPQRDERAQLATVQG